MNNLSEEIEKLADEMRDNRQWYKDQGLLQEHRDEFNSYTTYQECAEKGLKAGAKAMLELLEPTLKEVRGGLKGIHGCKRCIICGDYSYGALKKLDKILSRRRQDEG